MHVRACVCVCVCLVFQCQVVQCPEACKALCEHWLLTTENIDVVGEMCLADLEEEKFCSLSGCWFSFCKLFFFFFGLVVLQKCLRLILE